MGSVVSGVDLFDSVESSDVSEFLSSVSHELGNTFPGGWGDIDSSINVSLVALEDESADLDSKEGWDGDTSFKEGIESSNVGVSDSLEFFLEGSSSHTRDLGSEGTGNGITNVGSGESTEELSVL